MDFDDGLPDEIVVDVEPAGGEGTAMEGRAILAIVAMVAVMAAVMWGGIGVCGGSPLGNVAAVGCSFVAAFVPLLWFVTSRAPVLPRARLRVGPLGLELVRRYGTDVFWWHERFGLAVEELTFAARGTRYTFVTWEITALAQRPARFAHLIEAPTDEQADGSLGPGVQAALARSMGSWRINDVGPQVLARVRRIAEERGIAIGALGPAR